jgi:hypothetical protein
MLKLVLAKLGLFQKRSFLHQLRGHSTTTWTEFCHFLPLSGKNTSHFQFFAKTIHTG